MGGRGLAPGTAGFSGDPAQQTAKRKTTWRDTMALMPRRWNDIRWTEDRPSEQDLTDSWASLDWERQPLVHPELDIYLDHVRRTHVNGGHIVGRWRATQYADTTAWFMARNRFEEYDLFRVFFGHPTVRSDLADLQLPADLRAIHERFRQQTAGALTLDGLLAGILVNGGAYERFKGAASDAKDIANRVVAALTGKRYEDFRVDLSHEAWTPWFRDVAWDHTFVLTDRAKAEITVLCITDAD